MEFHIQKFEIFLYGASYLEILNDYLLKNTRVLLKWTKTINLRFFYAVLHI